MSNQMNPPMFSGPALPPALGTQTNLQPQKAQNFTATGNTINLPPGSPVSPPKPRARTWVEPDQVDLAAAQKAEGLTPASFAMKAAAYVKAAAADNLDPHSRQSLACLIESKLRADEQIEIISAPALRAMNLAEPTQIICDLLHLGSKMSLNANSKVGKTWTLLHLGMAVASGGQWLGFPTTQSKVLFVNFELQPWDMSRRIETVTKAMKTGEEHENMHFCNLRGRLENMPELMSSLRRKLIGAGYGLIILDPIYKLYRDLDENKAGDVARLMAELETLCAESGAAIVFSHHFSKGNQSGKEAIDRGSGSGVFGRDPDAIINITKHENDDCFIFEADLRSFKRQEPFGLRLDFPLLKRDSTVNPAKVKRSGASKAYEQQDILNVLLGGERTTEELRKAVMEETGMSDSTFSRLFRSVKDNPDVKKDPDTKKWQYRPSSVIGPGLFR